MSGRILVTGASGFVGSRTLGPLAGMGFDVHAVSRQPPAPGGTGVTWWGADLMDPGQARELVLGLRPSHVLHCAWMVDHGRFWTSPDNLDWAGATLVLARTAAEARVARFVGVGTCAEYDWSDGGALPRAEADGLSPTSLYGEAKAATFRLLSRFCGDHDISFAWARLFHLYGPGEHAGRLVPTLLADLAAGRPARVRHGALLRDYLAVMAAGEALAALAASSVTGPVNVASGRPVTLADLAGHAAAQAGLPGHVEVARLHAACTDVPAMTAQIGRLTGEVGWSPPDGWPALAEPASAR